MNDHSEPNRDAGMANQTLVLLTRLSGVAAKETDLNKLMNSYVQIMVDSLPCACCRILLFRPEGRNFQVAATAGDCESNKAEATLADLANKISKIAAQDEGDDNFAQKMASMVESSGPSHIRASLAGQKGFLGAMQVLFQAEQTIAPQHGYIIQLAASILSTALDRSRASLKYQKLDKELEDEIAKRTEWIQLLSETTVAANEAASVAEAMQTVLTKICLYTRWPVGHVYIPANDGYPGLKPTRVWFTRDPDRYQPFVEITQQTHFPIGASLPGEVFESAKPIWVEDISQKGFIRAGEAQRTGLKAAFAYPVLVQKEVVAVMEFFTDQAIPPDQHLLDVVANIGIQVGRVIERRRAQEELESSQRQLAEAHRIARLGTWEWDITSDKLTWSDRLFEIYGIDPDEFDHSYEGFLALVYPEDRQRIKALVDQAIANLTPFEFQHRIVRTDGKIRVLHARGDVITDSAGAPIRMVGTGQDITHRSKLEDELRTREELLRTVVTTAPIILWAVDRQGKLTLAEGMGLASLEVDPQSLIGKPITEILDSRKEVLDYIQRAFAGEQVVAEMTTGDYVFETRFAPMLDKVDEIVGVTGVSFDITGRVQAEAARQASDARFRIIFEGSPIGIGIISLDHKLLVANPNLRQMLGMTTEQIQSRPVESLIHPRDRANSEYKINALIEGDGPISHLEMRFIRNDRSPVWTSLSASLVRNPNGSPNFAIIMLEDITSRKQIEAELTEIQQQLVASREKERLHIAQEIHDDPLQNLYGLLYQLDSVIEEVGSEQRLTEIREMQTSINQIIDTLRGICRGLRPPTLMPFGLEVSIREHIDSFQKEHPDLKIHLDLMYDGQSLSEHIRLTLFRIYQQAISNVTRHAQANNVTVWFRFDDRQAELVVEDDGQGFSVPSRWIEFVRKDHMGLAGSAERIEILHGRFKVISSPGNGTRVEAVVPRGLTHIEEDTLAEEAGG